MSLFHRDTPEEAAFRKEVAEGGEIGTQTGGTFFIIMLPMLAEIDSEIKRGLRDPKGGPGIYPA